MNCKSLLIKKKENEENAENSLSFTKTNPLVLQKQIALIYYGNVNAFIIAVFL